MMSALSRRKLLALVAAVALSSPQLLLANEISVQQAVERVQKESNGKVLSVQTLQVGKRKIYRIKLLTSAGQVKVVEVKANE